MTRKGLFPRMTIVTFGKYKGQLLSSLPDNYLQWMSRELNNSWKKLALDVLNTRTQQDQQGRPVVSTTTTSRVMVTFGKFKDHYLDSLPDSQLEWMSKEMNSQHWSRLAQDVVDQRSGITTRDGGTGSSMDELKTLLRSCESLEEAQGVHAKLLKSAHRNDRYMSNLVVEMYGRFGDVREARKAFDAISHPNVFSYNIMLKVYADHGCLEEAKQMFDEMPETSLFTWNIMLGAYAKNADVHSTESFFNQMTQKDVVSWTTMLAAHINNGNLEKARSLFDRAEESSNTVTWNTMISGYARAGNMQEAQSLMDRMPHKKSVVTWNIMVDGYGQAGQVEQARSTFNQVPAAMRSQVTWNALLQAYVQNGDFEQAKTTFQEMPEQDEVSWTCMLRGHEVAGDLEGAKSTFTRIPPKFKTMVQQTIMIRAYSGAGELTSAKLMFDSIRQPDAVAWNSIILAYAQNGHFGEATSLFGKASQVDTTTWNIAIFAYASAGSCEEAKAVFDRMQAKKDIFSWNALLTGYAQNQRHEEAQELFSSMVMEGVNPNRVVFLAVLTLSYPVDQAADHFKSMLVDYGISPSLDHYNCMVEVLCRKKRLADGRELIENMPFLPDARLWMTLLAACMAQGNLDMGKFAFQQVLELDSQNAAAYVMLGNIYRKLGMKKELETLARKMKSNGVATIPGASLIEVGNQVNKFYVGDESHPKNKEIRAELLRLTKLMKKEGYIGKGGEYHSEKLAVAFGMISCNDKSTQIRVVNNIRMCLDCHDSMKLMSKITGHKIVVRDVQHVHHFKGGVCSCLDTW